MDSNGNTNMDMELSEIFGIEPAKNLPAIVEDAKRMVVESLTKTEEPEPTETFEYVQFSLRKLAKVGMTAVGELATIARQSESLDAYDVLTTNQKATADLLKLILSHETGKNIGTKNAESKATPKNVTNNTIVLTGSAENLLDAAKQLDIEITPNAKPKK